MERKQLIRRDFISWAQSGYNVRAIALHEHGWFMEAINCCRDGDMGDIDADGVYERVWGGDNINIYGDDEYDYKPATPHEVDLYLARCSVDFKYGEKVVAVVRGEESYVLYERIKPSISEKIKEWWGNIKWKIETIGEEPF